MKKLIIQGMHCGACEKLITMELEEAGLSEMISTFSEPKNNMGELTLKEDVSDDHVQQIEQVINKMDDYSVIKTV